MRKLVSTASLAGLMLLLSHAGVNAQGPGSSAHEENTAQATTPRLSFTQQNVFERASASARERQARIEAHKWQGNVPLRPVYYQHRIAGEISFVRGPWDRYYGYHPLYSGPVQIW